MCSYKVGSSSFLPLRRLRSISRRVFPTVEAAYYPPLLPPFSRYKLRQKTDPTTYLLSLVHKFILIIILYSLHSLVTFSSSACCFLQRHIKVPSKYRSGQNPVAVHFDSITSVALISQTSSTHFCRAIYNTTPKFRDFLYRIAKLYRSRPQLSFHLGLISVTRLRPQFSEYCHHLINSRYRLIAITTTS